jgi:hypothetical protein
VALKSLAASLIAVAAIGSLAACGGDDDSGDGDRDRAVAEAQRAYESAHTTPAALEQGPCLAEQLPGLEDWVVDIAHEPREAVDDDPANQCDRFKSGLAHHFVELTPEGELIRAE